MSTPVAITRGKMKKRIPLYIAFVLIALFTLGSDCDYGLKPRFTAVEGDIVITGDWPEEAKMCFLVVTFEKPEELVLDITLVQGMYQFPDAAFQENWDSTHFDIEMPAGEYCWVFFAILDSTAVEGDLGWRNLAAEYLIEGQDSIELGKVNIGEDEKSSIKIKVDFTVPYRGIGNNGPLDYFHLFG